MPLDGVLVADLSRVLAGPLATATLADLGADVVKVERPGTGDDTRAWGPPWSGDASSYFACANRSKRSLALDLADDGGGDGGSGGDLALARELVRRADVVVENFGAGVLARRGLGYADVAAVNPGVVYCSITGFGSRGGAGLPGYDFLVQAVGGLMSVTGAPDAEGGEPTKVGVALVDVLASKDAVTGILAALRARDLDPEGRGQLVEVDLLSSLLGSLANQASGWLATGTAPGRLGNAHPSIAPYEMLRCADAPIAVAVGNDAMFRRFVEALGRPGLAGLAAYRTNADRVAHRPALVADLEALLAPGTAADWVERLTAAGVPAGRVGSVADGFALAERLGLEPTVEVGTPDAPAPRQVRHPVTYAATPVTRYSAPPRLGQHDEELRAWLARPVETSTTTAHQEHR